MTGRLEPNPGDLAPHRAPERHWVPIRSLAPRHRDRIAHHLLELSERDRYLRFGFLAADDQIKRYVESLDFERDELLGIFNRRLQLLAMAHVAYLQSDGDNAKSCAEFG